MIFGLVSRFRFYIMEITIFSPVRKIREFIDILHGWGVKVLNFTCTPIDPASIPFINEPFRNLEIKGNLITAYLKA